VLVFGPRGHVTYNNFIETFFVNISKVSYFACHAIPLLLPRLRKICRREFRFREWPAGPEAREKGRILLEA
jgi:hypothetical protein